MYVFYPASRVVGLTFDYREFSQISPFPVKSFSVEPDTERNREPEAEEGNLNLTAIALGCDDRDSKSDCFPRRSPSPRSKTAKSQSESPVLAAKRLKKKKKSGGNSRVPSAVKSPEEIKLGQELKNLEIYFATKPRSLRRTWSKHFKRVDQGTVARMSGSECALRDMTHPALNDTLRAHNAVTFRLVKTVSEFTESLARIHEQHAEQMQLLVASFRKKNAEFRKEKPASTSTLFHSWETFLQEVEVDSQAHSDIAGVLGRQISRPLLEKSFFRKIQSRKVFSHRNTYENLIEDAEEKLGKTKLDYKTAYLAYMNGASSQSLAKYIACHNEYVSQLHLTNGMLAQYHSDTLPSMLQEIEDIYNDLCVKVSDSILQVAEMISSRAQDQAKRYDNLTSQCRSVQGPTDLGHLVRSTTLPGTNPPAKRPFAAPQPPPAHVDGQAADPAIAANVPPSFKNEIVLDRSSNAQVRDKIESAKKESAELESQAKQLSDALHTLARIQQRSIDSNLFNKVNELQEDISMKQQELNVALIRLAGLKAQKELFSNKVEGAETGRERKMSSSSTGSMKSKWMKAFKSLKTPPTNGSANKDGGDKRNGKNVTTSFPMDTGAHAFQDYTYKKITPCDVCSQVLRGHTRQGLKCRVCKVNVHVDCQEKAPKCQQKSRLLRRQKSTSEIDTKIQDPPLEEENCEVDKVYQVLKQASDLSAKVPGTGSRNPLASEASPPSAREEFYLEKTCLFDRKTELYYPNPKIQKSYSRSEYQSPEFHHQHPLPKSYKNRLSDPGVIHLNNAACLGSSSAVGTATSGPAAVDSVPQPRRQQGPLLLRGSAPHGLGPVPFATNSDEMDTVLRRRLFSGFKSFSVFGGKTRGETSSTRSISLPETPHSPRKQKLNLRMKSLSLDSPESTEHAQKRRAQASYSAGHSSQSSSSKLQSPSSPVHSRRLLSARNVRMSSVELPDDNERSLSSASTSPCPSPKPHRLLPTNLYVVLYNFKSRHPDELDLKAGYKVTVMDGSDPDWWKGKCLGRVGFFPSKYVIKLEPGERPLQVTHNLQVQDGDSGIMLLRDQIVIQVGEDIDGMVMIRSADNKQGPCPLKFLQEV